METGVSMSEIYVDRFESPNFGYRASNRWSVVIADEYGFWEISFREGELLVTELTADEFAENVRDFFIIGEGTEGWERHYP